MLLAPLPLKSIFLLLLSTTVYSNRSFYEISATDIHPSCLKAKSEVSKKDNPNWQQAIIRPFAEVGKKEISTLEGMNVWSVYELEDYMNVIDWTWTFKWKQLLNTKSDEFLIWICAHDNQK